MPQFIEGKPFVLYSAIAPDMRRRKLLVDEELWSIDLMDLSSTVIREEDPHFRPAFFQDILRRALGIVLIYDISSKASFDDITRHAYMYAWAHRKWVSDQGERYLTGKQRFGCVLVGNKADVIRADPSKREVSREMAEQWAQSQGFKHFELCANNRPEVETAIEALVKSVRRVRAWDDAEIEERKRMDRQEQQESKKSQAQASRTSFSSAIKQAFRTSN